jgi:hypothetical protein
VIGDADPVNIPTFATHYYRSDRAPFLNLSDLSERDASSVIADLKARPGAAHKRVFGRRYMELRRLTEARLHEMFVAAGGMPGRTAPHYFVLGTSAWYRALSPGMQEVRLELAQFPDAVTSFTYPDSFTAMAYAARFGLPYEPRPYHERVFRMRELGAVVERYGLPADEPEANYDGYQLRPFEKYIEIQLWSDAPLPRIMGE